MVRTTLLAAALLCGVTASVAAPAIGAEELLARLIDDPVPAANWVGVKASQNIPMKVDTTAGMLGTVALARRGSSVRYMVYQTPAAAQADFARQAFAPKEQTAAAFRELPVAGWSGPAFVCGEGLLAARPPQRVTTCAARHPGHALIVRVILPPSASAAAQVPRELLAALRHVDAVAAASTAPNADAAVRLYRALRNRPIPRVEAIAERLEGLTVTQDKVHAPNRADGVIGRLTLNGRGMTVRYAVFGANARIDNWVDRAAALGYDGYYAVGEKDALQESGNNLRLRAPARTQLWASRHGDALCDVVARHRSLPLAMRVSLPVRATVRKTDARGTYSVSTDVFDKFACLSLAIDLADWASERARP